MRRAAGPASVRGQRAGLAVVLLMVLLPGAMILCAQPRVGAEPRAATATPTPAITWPAFLPWVRFYGTVTRADGAAVPNGAVAVVVIGDLACGFGPVLAGQYLLDVPVAIGCVTPQATVRFFVAGAWAVQTIPLPQTPGTAVLLNLTLAAPPTPTPLAATRVAAAATQTRTPAPTRTPSPTPSRTPTAPARTATPSPPATLQALAPTRTPTRVPTPVPPIVRPFSPPVVQRPVALAAQQVAAAPSAPGQQPGLPFTGAGVLPDETGLSAAELAGVLLAVVALGTSTALGRRAARRLADAWPRP